MTQLCAGVDEVGRGCLAGPVYAAAVILPPRHGIDGLRDSKQLPPQRRERLSQQIRRTALAWAVGIASVDEIDHLNILRASLLAMTRAVNRLAPRPALCLVDGNQAPELDLPVRTVVGGDASVECIMAASIVAKVARDGELQRLDSLFPRYGFALHKGYGTPQHLQALRSFGPCALHRMSFAPCMQSSFRFPVSSFQNTQDPQRHDSVEWEEWTGGDADEEPHGFSGNRKPETGN